jgi:Plasma-membrane choline transporter
MFKDLSPVQSQRKEIGNSNGSSISQSYRGGSIHKSPNPYNPTSLRSPLRTSSRKLMNNVGGEAASIFKGVPSRESSRKKHQRQLSAQQYMEQIKGVEQPLQCRNVSFLLLFFFHLLFVGAYLGERYVKESLSPSTVPAVNPEIIRIDYQILMLVSVLSGGFAIILSTVLLALMTMFARNYLQISLFITIGMAFIWGTLGVGLSPKTVVPVTGIIALGFAVAYTFIVWDRLPFHSVNLMSALSGIKVFPTTVVLATFMQIVSLAWSVYFSVVAAGFYNAVQENKVPLSNQVIGICYFLFFLSFFWTYQVIHVSKLLRSPFLVTRKF